MKKSSSAQWSPNAGLSITLRPVKPEDEQFLLEVYASTRADEFAQISWSQDQLQAFLKMQLNARDQSYRMYYLEIDDRIILLDGRQVGRLIVVRTDEEIRLADIALLPKYRSSGVGTSLIRGLMTEADETNRPIKLQVEKSNQQARRFYERLGFIIIGENDTHFQVTSPPPKAGRLLKTRTS